MTAVLPPPEFPRPIRAHDIGQRRQHNIGASAPERAALASRFDLIVLDRLEATLETIRADGAILITGRISAAGSQPCARTGAPVPFTIAEPLTLRLVEQAPQGGESESEQMELSEADLDSEPLTSDIIDLGEYAAQALGLALDPYPRSAEPAPHVLSEDQARAASSPFAVLKKK